MGETHVGLGIITLRKGDLGVCGIWGRGSAEGVDVEDLRVFMNFWKIWESRRPEVSISAILVPDVVPLMSFVAVLRRVSKARW